MGRVIAHSGGIAHVHSAIEVNVVLEVSVIQDHAGIVAHQQGIACVDGSIRINVAPKETDLDAARTSRAAIRPGNTGSL